MTEVAPDERPYALLVQMSNQVPRALPAYLRLMLNYLYGLEVLDADQLPEATRLAMEPGRSLRAVFVVQDQDVKNRNALTVLGRRGETPVFLLMPPEVAARHHNLSAGMANVRVFDWDQSSASVQESVSETFAQLGLHKLPVGVEGMSPEQLQARLQQRLHHVRTLPTLPTIVVRLGRLLQDPATTAEDLERLLGTDPAIVYRLLQVANSAAIRGAHDGGPWTLKEAIVRLGHRRLGAIAQQVKLINSLVHPEDNAFDLRRFWEHSVGCACIADHLARQRLLPLDDDVDFELIWVAALLHDLGRLVLAFLAWDYYEDVVARTRGGQISFARAEERLGHTVTHEGLGHLMLLNAGISGELARIVRTHDTTGPYPGRLVCLIHVANGLTRDIGLGYYDGEPAYYSPAVLTALGWNRDRLRQLPEQLAAEVTARARELVSFCLPD